MKDFIDTISKENILNIIFSLVKAGLILIIGHYAVALIIKLIQKSFDKINMDVSLEKFLTKVINIALHIIVILSTLNALGISTTGLLAALSGAVVAIALALKDSLGSIAGGIIILITHRFETGDFIEVGGESGAVLQVDLMHTTLKTSDNRHVVIPNGIAVNSSIVDYSREENRRLDIIFPISYDDNAEKACKIILDTVKSHRSALNEPDPPFARVTEYAESAVNITLRVWCKTEEYWNLKFDLLEQVKKEFDQNGITIPYNRIDVCVSNND